MRTLLTDMQCVHDIEFGHMVIRCVYRTLNYIILLGFANTGIESKV